MLCRPEARRKLLPLTSILDILIKWQTALALYTYPTDGLLFFWGGGGGEGFFPAPSCKFFFSFFFSSAIFSAIRRFQAQAVVQKINQ